MVLLSSRRTPRVLRYSGYLLASDKHFAYGAITLSRLIFQKTSAMLVNITLLQVRTPVLFLTLVWAVPRSLAAT